MLDCRALAAEQWGFELRGAVGLNPSSLSPEIHKLAIRKFIGNENIVTPHN